MTESLLLLLNYIFTILKLERIEAWIRIDNSSSIKLVEKLWFIHEWTARSYKIIWNKKYDFYLYGLLKTDFFNRAQNLTKKEKQLK